MKILILSFHYAPDLCAGSFRSSALVAHIQAQAGPDLAIDVITTVPNRYASYQVPAPLLEQHPGLTIHRIPLPSHQSGMVDQALAFAYFAKMATKIAKKSQYDLVYASSSRLMGAALGTWVARRQQTKLYLDIRDIFVDTIKDVFSPILSKITHPILSWMEKWTFRPAHRINLVSKGFQEYFEQRYPTTALTYFTNGIDDEFLSLPAYQKTKAQQRLKVLYAGNIGEGQGLHRIIPTLAKSCEDQMQFIILGDGGRKPQLEAALHAAGCDNVELRGPVHRAALIDAYQEADVLFLHLNDYDAFRKVLPSKIFEYAAMSKPIWAGVAGHARAFLQAEMDNVAVFTPCDAQQAKEVFSTLTVESTPRAAFIEKYKRESIMKDMAAELLSLMK